MENIYGDKFLSPNINFNAVRDGRRSPVFWKDVDLSTARNIAAGTAEEIIAAGDSFYADIDPDNQGDAVVHFEDTNLNAPGAPMYITRGHISKLPFTRLLIENAAQPGKRLRFFYGVGLDFDPGSASSVNIAGNVSVVNDKLETDSINGIAYAGAGGVAALAANYSTLLLWNPAGSGKKLIVTEVTAVPGAGPLYLGYVNALPGTAVGLVSPRSKSGDLSTDPTTVLYSNQQAAALLPAAQRTNFTSPAAQGNGFMNPYIVSPGTGLIVESSGVNVDVYAAFHYRTGAL